MIITCAACGAANTPDEAFCVSCSAFLEWEGTQVRDVVTATAARHAVAGVSAHDRSPSAATVVTAAVTPPTPGGMRTDPDDVEGPDDPDDPEDPDDALPHQLPQEEASRPAPRRGVPVARSDLYCGSCGSGNAEGRRFCRSCGVLLEDEGPRAGWIARRVQPMWTRLTARLHRRGRSVGQRPAGWSSHAARQQRRRWSFRLPTRIGMSRIALPLMVLSLFGFGLSPLRVTVTSWAFTTYESIKREIHPQQVDIKPARATSNAAVKDHGALTAIDQNLSTYWVGRSGDKQVGTTITVEFSAPTDLSAIGIVNGAPGQLNARLSRVRTIQVDTTDAVGGRTRARVDVVDSDSFRTYPLVATTVTKVVVTVLDVYPGQESPVPALTELSFHLMT